LTGVDADDVSVADVFPVRHGSLPDGFRGILA
jgi:hypothetical protein